MPLGTCVISFSYRQYERLHFIYGRFRFYQCCLRDLLRRQSASTRLRSGRPSSSPAGDARLCRIFRAESLRSDGITRPRSELLGPSKYRSILPSNHCKIPSYLASRSLNKCRAIGIDPILSYPILDPGRRTRFRLGPDRPRPQLYEHPCAPKPRHRDSSRVAARRSHRQSAVERCRRRMGRSRAAALILGRPRTPHLARNSGGATPGRECAKLIPERSQIPKIPCFL